MSEAAQPNLARNVGNIALWALQVLLAAYFAYSGVSLLGDDFVGKFDKIGFGQWLRYVTGVLELAGALGLLIPRLCGLAALGLVGVMSGAVATELVILGDSDGAVLPALLLVLAAVVAWFRRDTIRALLQAFGK
ncbi:MULTISPECIES: DoxX family protein [Saccharothrix]|uniref:DoxX family protein n=1 Tax=Saccharothrix TaxID=2071 RepID=UPI00093DFEDD|nr:DoxX family protein [Saccharothrix sp. CB00851]OKI33094.1 DoxX family protein [Saccharothrix sp. CB00851]